MAHSRSRLRHSKRSSVSVKTKPKTNFDQLNQHDRVAEEPLKELDSLIETMDQANYSNEQSVLDLQATSDTQTQHLIQSLFQRFESRIDAFLWDLDQRIATTLQVQLGHGASHQQQTEILIRNSSVDIQTDIRPTDHIAAMAKTDEPAAAATQFNWEKQKQQMFADFGILEDKTDPKNAILDQPKSPTFHQTNLDQDGEKGIRSDHQLNSVNNFEGFRDSIAKLDRIQSTGESDSRSDELESLKEQLTAQLREAEIELSINRAKLSQEWAALEQRETLLAQRESDLKSKYSPKDEEGKAGLLDRFTRHLSQFNRK